MFVQRQSDLWRDVNEAFTKQKPDRFAGVTEDLFQLFRHTVRGVLLTLIHNKLLHLLHTLHTLPTADTHNNDTLNEQASPVNNVNVPSSQHWSYLPLCEVEHSDEAVYFVRVVIVTVFWHLSLLEQSESMSEYIDRTICGTSLTHGEIYLDDTPNVILLNDDVSHLRYIDMSL